MLLAFVGFLLACNDSEGTSGPGGGSGAFSGISLVYGGSGRWLEVGRSAAR